jgi:hypothetical protein
MRQPKVTRPQPPKLNLVQIDNRLKQLDAEGWLKELTKLYVLSVTRGLGLHEPHPAIQCIQCGGKTIIGIIPFPTVQFVGPHMTGVQLTRQQLPVLIINLTASDADIFASLKRTLKEVRKHLKLPVAKRGRFALNSRIEDTFEKWRNDKIVPLIYLLTWRKALSPQDKKLWPEHRLGQSIGLKEPKNVSDAKETLKKALKNLPALAMRIADERTPKKIAEEMIAARIAKDVQRRD